MTRNKDYKIQTNNTFILKKINKHQIEKLKSISKKNLWLVGGGILITQFLDNDWIDEMTISVIPIILGNGIRLFPDNPKETRLAFVKSEVFETGVVNLTYQRIKNNQS